MRAQIDPDGRAQSPRGTPEVRPRFSIAYANNWDMPSMACHTTVDIAELGFDTSGPTDAEIIVATTGERTLVEVAHTDNVWSLTFDADGALVDAPAYTTPARLGSAVKKAAPQLRVT